MVSLWRLRHGGHGSAAAQGVCVAQWWQRGRWRRGFETAVQQDGWDKRVFERVWREEANVAVSRLTMVSSRVGKPGSYKAWLVNLASQRDLFGAISWDRIMSIAQYLRVHVQRAGKQAQQHMRDD